ncbi:MAG: hypothetical protein ACYC35_03805 [Pirellulales bacterium]
MHRQQFSGLARVAAAAIDVPRETIVLASGRPVRVSERDGKRVFTLDVDVADVIVCR